MSAILRYFRRNSRDESDLKGHKVHKKKNKKKKLCARCQGCKCVEEDSHDFTDGKTFSKTLPITLRAGGPSHNRLSCCEKDSTPSPNEHYRIASTEDYATDPNPFLNTIINGISYMPVSKDSPHYNMNHARRGKAIIFNFDRWENTNAPDLELKPRLGSQKDKKDLAKCLRRLDFQVEEHDNVESRGENGIWEILGKVQYEDHTDADCLVVVVMTHGEKNTVYMKDGVQIPINLIWQNFEADRCPTLAGKPKIFIVQACRGKQYDNGTTLRDRSNNRVEEDSSRSDVTDASTFSYVIPNAADILVAFSCPLGHYSWRHPERGSWFIQAICKVFNQHAYDMDLQLLFTTVAREVALNYESSTDYVESNNKKQVPSTSSTFIRSAIFKPKSGPRQNNPIDNNEVAQMIANANANVHAASLNLNEIAQEIANNEEGSVTLQSITNTHPTNEIEISVMAVENATHL